MMVLNSLTVLDDRDPPAVRVSVTDDTGVLAQFEYSGEVTSKITAHESGYLLVRVEVVPPPRKHDNTSASRF